MFQDCITEYVIGFKFNIISLYLGGCGVGGCGVMHPTQRGSTHREHANSTQKVQDAQNR